ncbi:vWA domain-containing protein [Flavobacterium tegetincola]|uniref:vWA domain-containing protein n=1 Tax=Flavobacterium tegetincola TaxID=150172 RepID=UPI00041AC6C8|nr:vWA domain-containing protein [Flavobacterium tegetincola]
MKKIIFTAIVAMALLSCSRNKTKEAPKDSYATEEKATAKEKVTSDENQSQQQKQLEAGQVTAGEWNDLENWPFWYSINKDSTFLGMAEYWGYHLDNRISINLQSGSSILADVLVELVNGKDEVIWQSKTNNKGNAELWPFHMNGNQSTLNNLKIRVGNQLFKDLKVAKNKEVNNLVLTNAVKHNTEKKIDIAFMFDATGSMGDEMDYLKVELTDVIAKVKTKNPTATINLGAVFYRDNGDDYVTRKSDFSTNIDQTVDFIKKQSADGGGDFPEAVDIALNESIKDLQWSSDATSRILFLVLDAPPHHEKDVITKIHNLIALASSKGIKIIPITASGIDKETEFLMRYMAIATNGTYVFITNDSGIGDDHLVASVGKYQVELLNSLMERLINESLK